MPKTANQIWPNPSRVAKTLLITVFELSGCPISRNKRSVVATQSITFVTQAQPAKAFYTLTVKSNKGAFVCLCLRMWEAKMSQNVINYEMLLKSVRLKTETDIMCVGHK